MINKSLLNSARQWAWVVVLGWLASSCATIFSGTTQKVKLKSYPSGARIYHNGHDTDLVTPAKITINRAVAQGRENKTNEHVYRFELDGYQSATFRDKRRTSGVALFGDIVFGVVPVIVDFATGAIYRYHRRVSVKLRPEEQPKQPIVNKQAEKPIVVAPPVEQPAPKPPVVAVEPSVETNIPKARAINENAVAVVIGNKNYISADIPEVEYAWNDAETVKRYLVEAYGFYEGNILFLPDATLTDLNRTFGTKGNPKARLFNLIKPGVSDVFVYYSGHGAPDTENQEGYLVPTDCRDASLIQFEGYSLNTLYANLNELPFRSLTLVVDACFSGNSESGMLVKQASPVYLKTNDRLVYRENVAVLNSADNGQISSWYAPQKHSLFTYYFLRGLQGEANTDSDRSLSLLEMRVFLSEKVPQMARRLHNRSQTPSANGDDRFVLLGY